MFMQSKTNLKYHLIFVTKYSKKVLTPDIMRYCVSVLSKVLLEKDCEILAIKGDNEDHVHILFQCKPSISISLLVQLLKQKKVLIMYGKNTLNCVSTIGTKMSYGVVDIIVIQLEKLMKSRLRNILNNKVIIKYNSTYPLK